MRSLSALVLVVACAAMGLGLAHLAFDVADRDGVIQRHSPNSIDLVDTSGSALSSVTSAGEPAVTQSRSGAMASGDPPSISTSSPPRSPLYPQNGVTLWDRIRVSSKRDRSAFLLGVSIQIHAPETAATPGPRS